MRYDANTIVTIRILYTFLPDRCDYLKDLRICISLFFFLRSAICFCFAAQMFFSLRFPPHFVPTNFMAHKSLPRD